MKERWARLEDGGWQFYRVRVNGSRKVYVVDMKEELLKALGDYKGDTVLVPVAVEPEAKGHPRVLVDKTQVVGMVERFGAWWTLQVHSETSASLDPVVPPTDFRFE